MSLPRIIDVNIIVQFGACEMLRRASGRLRAIALTNRPLTLQHIRLASFKTHDTKARDAPPIKAYQTVKRAPPTPDGPPTPSPGKRFDVRFVLDAIKWVSLAFLSLHIFVEYFYLYSGSYGISMMPNLNPSGDWLFISKYYRRGRGIEVGDLVSFRHPVKEGDYAVKRVMGLEGDFVLMNTPGKSDAMIQVGLKRDQKVLNPLTL